jgi:hypothetical protein
MTKLTNPHNLAPWSFPAIFCLYISTHVIFYACGLMPVGYRATSQPERIVNKSYKTIFNKTLGVWQAVAEIARAQGKSKNAITPPAGQ